MPSSCSAAEHHENHVKALFSHKTSSNVRQTALTTDQQTGPSKLVSMERSGMSNHMRTAMNNHHYPSPVTPPQLNHDPCFTRRHSHAIPQEPSLYQTEAKDQTDTPAYSIPSLATISNNLPHHRIAMRPLPSTKPHEGHPINQPS